MIPAVKPAATARARTIPRPARVPAGLARRASGVARERELRRFRPRLVIDPEASVLLLSPHWDDAVFNCWSLLTGAGEVAVVNVFGGVPAPGPARRWDRICGGEDAREQAQARVAEDALALALAGRVAANASLLDAEYREPGPDPGLAEIDAAVAAIANRASAVYAPAALGMNPDHRLLRRYARALNGLGIPAHLYADLPYCVVHGWPHWVDRRPPPPHRDVDAFWRSFLVDVPEIADLRAASVARLQPDEAARKLAAMRTYETQFDALDGGGSGPLSNPGVHGFEVFWRLAPPGAVSPPNRRGPPPNRED